MYFEYTFVLKRCSNAPNLRHDTVWQYKWGMISSKSTAEMTSLWASCQGAVMLQSSSPLLAAIDPRMPNLDARKEMMQLLKRFHPTGNPWNSPNSGGWQTWLAAHSDIIKYHFAAASMRLERAFMSVRYIHANILLSSCSSDGWLLFHSPMVSSRNMCHTTFQAAICVPVKNLTFILILNTSFLQTKRINKSIWSTSLGKHWFFETVKIHNIS